MREFKKGDSVKIRKSSHWYGTSLLNPADEEGIVTNIFSYEVYVEWKAGTNSYKSSDLELVNKEPIINNSYDIY